jgi:hypothetical protein
MRRAPFPLLAVSLLFPLLAEMYNMNGVVVSPMCPMPAMTPDANGKYPE